MMDRHQIVITPEPFGSRYDVAVIPPFQSGPNHDKDFTAYKEARGYADGLRLVTGLPVRDLCEEVDG